MLYSPNCRVALARFPKTAGTSLANWFEAEFPDAVLADSQDPHVPVFLGLQRFGYASGCRQRSWRRLMQWPFSHESTASKAPVYPLIIGVLREPFEMLVSLFNYWRRRVTLEPGAGGSLGHIAVTRDFTEFLRAAVVERKMPTYRRFFDVGGPAWSTTRLLDFRSLKPALEEVCREHGIRPPAWLPAANVAPQAHDLAVYRDQAGPLLGAVQARYRWYYRHADRVMIRG
jgi:hypothetical protein